MLSDSPGGEGEGGDERRKEEMKVADSRSLSHRSTTKRSAGKAGQENKCGAEWLGSPHSEQAWKETRPTL